MNIRIYIYILYVCSPPQWLLLLYTTRIYETSGPTFPWLVCSTQGRTVLAMVHFAADVVLGGNTSIRAKMMGSSTWVTDHVVLQSLRGWFLHVPFEDVQVPGDGAQFTLFHFEVKHIEGGHALMSKTHDSMVLGHCGDPSFHQIVELCCGLGGISTGAYYAGLQSLGALDHSEWAVQVYNES